ncbi:MAG: D-glycero-beta-D-manno-heptose 1-phosphate adenylyltransferase [Gemmatimonadetes bacterium]|nr:MAG: D-glycero-beta-D-manno-heptose 1-phosphate adenylyltransferase [Gemmatimonadota bacterium]
MCPGRARRHGTHHRCLRRRADPVGDEAIRRHRGADQAGRRHLHADLFPEHRRRRRPARVEPLRAREPSDAGDRRHALRHRRPRKVCERLGGPVAAVQPAGGRCGDGPARRGGAHLRANWVGGGHFVEPGVQRHPVRRHRHDARDPAALAVDPALGRDARRGFGPVSTDEKIRAPEDAARWRERQRGPVVFTNGVFDLLHVGHVALLEAARAEGGALVVGVNSDASVRRLEKGTDRPIVPERERARLLAALACVDCVVLFDEDTPLALIERLRPDVLVKGADYARRAIVGADQVEGWGGRVVRVPLVKGASTSQLLARLRGKAGR